MISSSFISKEVNVIKTPRTLKDALTICNSLKRGSFAYTDDGLYKLGKDVIYQTHNFGKRSGKAKYITFHPNYVIPQDVLDMDLVDVFNIAKILNDDKVLYRFSLDAASNYWLNPIHLLSRTRLNVPLHKLSDEEHKVTFDVFLDFVATYADKLRVWDRYMSKWVTPIKALELLFVAPYKDTSLFRKAFFDTLPSDSKMYPGCVLLGVGTLLFIVEGSDQISINASYRLQNL